LGDRQLEPLGSPKNNEWVYHLVDVDVKLSGQDVMDGLELLCETALDEDVTGCPAVPPKMESLGDLSGMASYLQCLGDDIEHAGGTSLFRHLPKSAIGPLLSAGGTYDTEAGDMGAAVSALRQALMDVATSGPIIGSTIREFGAAMKTLRSTMKGYDVNDKMADVRFTAEVAQRASECAVAGTNAASVSSEVQSTGGAAVAAGITCVNALAQMGFADKLRDLGKEETAAARETAIGQFNQQFETKVLTLQEQGIKLSTALEQVRSSLGVIESLKQAARRTVNAALWHMEEDSTSGQLSSLITARKETAFRRYSQAHENAKRMAFLAKRAIEQRLGVRLSDMREDLPLVDAPQTWESTLCATSGIDLSKEGALDTKSFADTYIGDYVRKLENVVESYRLVNNFHEGSDFLVASLRDDILGVREECTAQSSNLLRNASALDRHFAGWDKPGVWNIAGCTAGENGVDPDCVAISKLAVAPFVPPRELLHVRGYSIAFSTDDDLGVYQKVHLEPGAYVYSWYSPAGDAGLQAGSILTPNGGEVSRVPLAPNGPGLYSLTSTTGWTRRYMVFEVNAAGDYQVGFVPSGTGPIKVAAPMLESVSPVSVGTGLEPRPFSDSDEEGMVTSLSCSDDDGSTFREKNWTRGCVFLCPDGYSNGCGSGAVKRCYRETSFHISQRGLAKGVPFEQAGFAEGNFNYRMARVGLNFVGTGIQNCAESETPSACYGNGFVQYSLYHEGPYYVRNHFGDDFRAYLFTGRIERARGLALERYLTNPLASSDGSLIEQYSRGEFVGRPLDGGYVLRVWEDEGIDFNQIEDVQLMLNYGYWTRFD
jgi:hypothetical protein